MFPSSSSSVVKLEPWGSSSPWDDVGDYTGIRSSPWDEGGGYTGIRSITIQHSSYGVETIQVEYDLFGESVLGEKHGGGAEKWDPHTDKIDLKFPEEFLTAVKGYCYDRENIKSLTFRTNRNKEFGPFPLFGYRYYSGGAASGSKTYFGCSVEGGRGAIVGFSGMSGWYLDSMAIYLAVLCPAGEFFDEMQKQGLVAYRTSPLCMPRPSKYA